MFSFRLRHGALVLGFTCLAGCGSPKPALAHRFEVGCTQRYRMRVDGHGYQFEIDPGSSELARVRWWPEDEPTATRTRSLDLSPARIGPAAPDAACRDRVHDPFEDFVALAFVRFDPKLRSSSWRGEPVSGDGQSCATPGRCCAPLVCDNMPENEHGDTSCQLGYWREERVAPSSSETLIELRSTWKNGQEGPRSTHTSRFVDFDLPHGRTLRSRVSIEFGDARAPRQIEILALDRCNGIQPLAGA